MSAREILKLVADSLTELLNEVNAEIDRNDDNSEIDFTVTAEFEGGTVGFSDGGSVRLPRSGELSNLCINGELVSLRARSCQHCFISLLWRRPKWSRGREKMGNVHLCWGNRLSCWMDRRQKGMIQHET